MPYSLPLFPLNLVIFPDGLLPLRIFEARYLDMIRACLRNKTTFGVVAVYAELADAHANATNTALPFAKVGTAFSILDADVTHPGLITIRCHGEQRFRVKSAVQEADGLWVGQVEDIASESGLAIPDDLKPTQLHMQKIIDAIIQQGVSELEMPIGKPYKLNDCAWVANRWCEILNIPVIQKQRMLELDSALVRLELVQDILTSEFSDK